jgi:catechol 2,3-dioxygenase-like lactoylglutathione lyase family enzyme
MKTAMEGTTAMKSGLQFVVRHVTDVDAARAFYTEKLGFEVEVEQPGFVQFKAPDGAPFAVSLASADPVAAELPSGQSEPLELWWYVDDADAAYAELRAKDVEIVFPPKDLPFGRAFAVKDPAGGYSFILQPPR